MIEFDLGGGLIGDCYSPMYALTDWSKCKPTKEQIDACTDGKMQPDRERLIEMNIEGWAQYVGPHSTLQQLAGMRESDTVILIGSGPSAAGIAKRIAPWQAKGLKVCTLNLGTTLIHNPDYVACYERLAKPEWFKAINPSKSALLCAPMIPKELLSKWKDGENVWFSWIADMHQSADPRWACLEPLLGAYTTSSTALHALCQLGYKNVLLAGMDFSSAAPNMSGEVNEAGDPIVSAVFYADGTPASESYVSEQLPRVCKGIHGVKMVSCSMQWNHMLAMRSTCGMATRAGHRVINCCGQGVLELDECIVLEDALTEILGPVVGPEDNGNTDEGRHLRSAEPGALPSGKSDGTVLPEKAMA